MKINNYLPLAIATLAIAAGNTALAGFTIPQQYSATPVTFALIINIQIEGDYSSTPYSDTYTPAVYQQRIGNPQIIQMLKDQGVIGQNATGWSIVLVSEAGGGLRARDSDSNDGNTLVGFYLTKVGREPININGYLGFQAGASTTVTGSSTTTYDGPYYTTTDAYSHTGFRGLVINLFDSGAYIFGTAKYKTVSTYTYTDGPTGVTHNINSLNMSNVSGFFGPDYDYSVTGKITSSTAAGTPIYLDF